MNLPFFKKEESKQEIPKDAYILPISDLHACSTTAVFPYWYGQDLPIEPHENMRVDGTWKFKHNIYTPTYKQIKLFHLFTEAAERAAEARKGKRLVFLGNGDMYDGTHHGTHQIATSNLREQVSVASWLLKYFLAIVGFDHEKGDRAFVLQGTESHDGDDEDGIAEAIKAEKLPSGDDVADFLQVEINNRLIWCLHQGAGVGKGANKGNALRNWMKNKYIERLEQGKRVPDVVMSGHYHDPWYEPLARMGRIVMHGLILPPWQLKTRFGYRVAAAEIERVGISALDISQDGNITVHPHLYKEIEEEVVRL